MLLCNINNIKHYFDHNGNIEGLFILMNVSQMYEFAHAFYIDRSMRRKDIIFGKFRQRNGNQ